jgi:ElaB/YqjD/DUF883 family membrane-anchored ribosome-binding protein
MPPRKPTKPSALDTTGAKIASPVPKGVIDTATGEVGVPTQPDDDPHEELGALRRQVETLQKQVSAATLGIKGGAREAARQTEATVKLHPVSTLVAVAAVVGAIAFAIAGSRSTPPRSRYDRALDEMRDLYDKVRDRI